MPDQMWYHSIYKSVIYPLLMEGINKDETGKQASCLLG